MMAVQHIDIKSFLLLQPHFLSSQSKLCRATIHFIDGDDWEIRVASGARKVASFIDIERHKLFLELRCFIDE